MKIALVYIFPNVKFKTYEPQAKRFANQYVEHPPGKTDHELYVVVNGGGKITPRQETLFSPLAPRFLHHNNYGKDVGAYQMAARTIPCDLLVCIGSPVRPRQAGWLDRMVQVFEDCGPAVYGQWGYHAPSVHLRTTVFWIPPALSNAYPYKIDNESRYQFEFGSKSITQWCRNQGLPAYMVTWTQVRPADHFCHVEQQDALFIDQHCENAGWKD